MQPSQQLCQGQPPTARPHASHLLLQLELEPRLLFFNDVHLLLLLPPCWFVLALHLGALFGLGKRGCLARRVGRCLLVTPLLRHILGLLQDL
jgi:hypothetical protein